MAKFLVAATVTLMLAGCSDPGLRYVIYPADTPGILACQTNPYAAGDAPRYCPGGGGFGGGGRH